MVVPFFLCIAFITISKNCIKTGPRFVTESYLLSQCIFSYNSSFSPDLITFWLALNLVLINSSLVYFSNIMFLELKSPSSSQVPGRSVHPAALSTSLPLLPVPGPHLPPALLPHPHGQLPAGQPHPPHGAGRAPGRPAPLLLQPGGQGGAGEGQAGTECTLTLAPGE